MLRIMIFFVLMVSSLSQAQELTWTSPNARIPSFSYEEGCAYSINNYCSFVPGSRCVSTSPGAVSYYDNGGRPYAACSGTATFEYMDGSVRKTRTVTGILDAVYSAPLGFMLADPIDMPPMQQCAGNPIDVGTGMKIQREEDIPSKGIGQVSITRTYAYRAATVQTLWRNNYQSFLQLLTSIDTSSHRFKSPQYPDKISACVSGWQNI